MILGQVACLGPVAGGVVEFPHVVVEGHPEVQVDRAVVVVVDLVVLVDGSRPSLLQLRQITHRAVCPFDAYAQTSPQGHRSRPERVRRSAARPARRRPAHHPASDQGPYRSSVRRSMMGVHPVGPKEADAPQPRRLARSSQLPLKPVQAHDEVGSGPSGAFTWRVNSRQCRYKFSRRQRDWRWRRWVIASRSIGGNRRGPAALPHRRRTR